VRTPFLPNDYARCKGVSSTEDGVTTWREGCEDCLRVLSDARAYTAVEVRDATGVPTRVVRAWIPTR
jgi:hypothetical protein